MKSEDVNFFNVGPRLILTFIVLVALILGGNGFLIWQFQLARRQTDRLTEVSRQLVAVQRLQETLLKFHQRLDEIAHSKDVGRLATEAESSLGALLEQSQQARNALPHLPPEIPVDPMEAIEVTLPSQLADITRLAKSGDWEAVNLRIANQLKPMEAQTAALVNSIDPEVSGEMTQAVGNMGSLQRRILLIVPTTAICTFVVAAFFGWSIARRIIDLRTDAEKALRRSEAYLAEAQRLTHTGSWAWNLRTGELYWSQELCRMYGLDPQVKPTWPWFLNRVHPEDRARIERQAKMESTEKDWTVSEIEFRVVLWDGTIKHVQAISYRVADKSGETTEVMGTVMDVTERKRAEQERERLRQLEADLAHINRLSMIGELAASLAHEIKQPITAAATNARTSLRWLQRTPPDMEEARETVSRVVSDVNRAADIIDHLRGLYKKGAPAERELVDVNEVACEMIVLLRSEAHRYSIAMRTDLAAELPQIKADRVQLQQVFMNLMLNGIEAMRDTGGELTVKSERTEDDRVLISIHDTGVGLPNEKIDEIFSAFYTTKDQGTGMGLSISRTIVESHGGRLWASANSGRGATFHFTLPAEAKVPSPSAA